MLVSSADVDVAQRAADHLEPAVRRHFRLRLQQEVRRLRRRGIPSSSSSRAPPTRRRWAKAMDPERNAPVVRSADETSDRARLEHGRHADQMAMLAA